jgi:adenine-specific DNA-methyltransferase
MEKISNCSLNLEQKNIEKLKNLFPEAVQEGQVDFDILKTLLGSEIIGGGQEHYQFTWNGKYQSIKTAQTPSSATLRPCKEKSKNWDTTENLYIEGDNLEVLKQLQKTYYGKIKMIYIDPPYNTGNDFVYHDNFSNSMENYKEQTNQVSSSNPESNGRYHTDWLNMIYPRILLARSLLRDDGVIFISIDDTEQDNLKKICDEIFSSTNFIANIIWKRKRGRDNSAKWFSKAHEYCLVYAKNKMLYNTGYLELDEETKKAYKNPDNDPRGDYRMLGCWARGTQGGVRYDFTTKDGQYFKERLWLFSKENLEKLDKEDKLIIRGDNIYRKMFIYENKGKIPETLWDDVSNAANASDEIKKLFNGIVFDTPKPTPYIKRMIQLSTNNSDIILDFFSGSATTANAVFTLNREDKGNRKFIMVQLPELCSEKSQAYKAGYKNICEIGEERIRRAGEQIKSEWEKEHPSNGLFGSEEQFTTDIGFKVFKLDSTNINEWDPNMKLDEKELAMRLGEVFKEGRSKEDILYEIMLKYGVFDKQVEEINVNGKIMYRVGKRYMIVCLDDQITSDDVKAIGELSPKTVIFNEAGFRNDNDKINAIYNLKQCGVEDIKCI